MRSTRAKLQHFESSRASRISDRAKDPEFSPEGHAPSSVGTKPFILYLAFLHNYSTR